MKLSPCAEDFFIIGFDNVVAFPVFADTKKKENEKI
jgi:hypothetical protein